MKQFVTAVALAAAATGGTSAAQERREEPKQPQPGRSAPGHDEQVRVRYDISVMEGVLERAVKHGADQLRRQVRRLVPDVLLLSGGAEARGFPLDGFGVFFDVEVPVMRQSMAWTLRTMVEENGMAAGTALQQLKAAVERMTPDAREKAVLMQAIKRLEMQVGPGVQAASATAAAAAQRVEEPGRAAEPGGTTEPGKVTAMEAAPTEPAAVPTPEDMALLEDPNSAYEKSVIDALIDAMLEHGASLRIAPDEWLTVAARDNEHRNLVAGEPYELLTIVLRIKGSDLAARREGRITHEEARKRVEVREF